ncbi:MAG: hypothetical protein EZS28_026113 [Streblomastix strix]|uniref:Uncharacterized protein n=1 Tax=Streblomastix strix TaxID=222440 RepID=A0A5J4V6H1_9EUKA|nr:MAG: hypothetical protein EZS28_026113 [Streblomastix strix]
MSTVASGQEQMKDTNDTDQKTDPHRSGKAARKKRAREKRRAEKDKIISDEANLNCTFQTTPSLLHTDNSQTQIALNNWGNENATSPPATPILTNHTLSPQSQTTPNFNELVMLQPLPAQNGLLQLPPAPPPISSFTKYTPITVYPKNHILTSNYLHQSPPPSQQLLCGPTKQQFAYFPSNQQKNEVQNSEPLLKHQPKPMTIVSLQLDAKSIQSQIPIEEEQTDGKG